MLIEICKTQGEYMKFTKMSLVAALLIGSSAFAIDNVKVSGDAKLYYSTNDIKTGNTGGLFDARSSAAQASFGLGITADLAKGISSGAHLTGLTTLGLEHQLVNNVWEGTNGVTDSYILDEAWVAATLGKTTAKLGRMELDTPLTFTEKWSVAKNTFEAVVLLNQDLPDTTLVAAYVGGSNSNSDVNNANFAGKNHGNGNNAPTGIANTVQNSANGTTFSQYYNGAFAVAAINNSFKPVTLQAWYYDAPQFLDAYWLQADASMQGFTAGVQFTQTNWVKSADLPIAKNASNNALAAVIGYNGMKDLATIKVAYSTTGTETDSSLSLGAGGNIATYRVTSPGAGALSGATNAHSKLYTEAWWNYGYVTRADTDAWNVTIESPVNGLFDLGLYYTSTSTGTNNASTVVGGTNNGLPLAAVNMTELTVTASKTVGPLDATLAYIYTNADDQNIKTGATKGSAYSTIQAYLTLNF